MIALSLEYLLPDTGSCLGFLVDARKWWTLGATCSHCQSRDVGIGSHIRKLWRALWRVSRTVQERGVKFFIDPIPWTVTRSKKHATSMGCRCASPRTEINSCMPSLVTIPFAIFSARSFTAITFRQVADQAHILPGVFQTGNPGKYGRLLVSGNGGGQE